jgi:hypothetical protein
VKRLTILISVILLFEPKISFSNETIFLCKNDNGIEREFELKINLSKKLIIRAGNIYNIIKELENELIAKISNKDGKVLREATLTFNRSSGNLKYQGYQMEGNKVVHDNANYSCKKRLI